MHKNGSSSANYSTRKVDGQKINKRGRSNKGMVDGFFCKINKRGTFSIRYYRVRVGIAVRQLLLNIREFYLNRFFPYSVS